MLDFQDEVEAHFANIIQSYGLHVLPVEASEIWLVGSGFALAILHDRDDIRASVITRNPKNELVQYDITNTLMTRFTQADRDLYGEPTGIEDRTKAAMRVYASGLANHWDDLLRGDMTWLLKLQQKDPRAWRGQPLQAELSDFIARRAPGL